MTHPVVTNAGWVQASNEMLAEAEAVRTAFARAVDRYLHPWNYPDVPIWPVRFDLFPRTSALVARWGQWRNRCSLARDAMRGDLDDWDEAWRSYDH